MLRIMTVAAAAALVALALGAGRPVRAEDDCDAVTKHALAGDRERVRSPDHAGTRKEKTACAD